MRFKSPYRVVKCAQGTLLIAARLFWPLRRRVFVGCFRTAGHSSAGEGRHGGVIASTGDPPSIGPYRLLRLDLGTRGMGQVFLGRSACNGRLVAVKVIRPDLAGEQDFRLARFMPRSPPRGTSTASSLPSW